MVVISVRLCGHVHRGRAEPRVAALLRPPSPALLAEWKRRRLPPADDGSSQGASGPLTASDRRCRPVPRPVGSASRGVGLGYARCLRRPSDTSAQAPRLRRARHPAARRRAGSPHSRDRPHSDPLRRAPHLFPGGRVRAPCRCGSSDRLKENDDDPQAGGKSRGRGRSDSDRWTARSSHCCGGATQATARSRPSSAGSGPTAAKRLRSCRGA